MANIIAPKSKITASATASFVVDGTDGGASEKFGVLEGTMGPRVVEIGKLYAKTGHFT